MAKTAKPDGAAASPGDDRHDDAVATEIDADEFEAAKRDPVVKEFARQADATVRALRDQGRLS